MTYVGDFFKRLFRKSNIPMIIYLVINLALVFVGTSVLIAMLTSDNPLDDAAFIVVSILASILLYGVGIIVALSPLGEYILRTKLGCKEIKEQDILNRIVPIFNEVHAAARRVNPSIAEDIKLFMNDDEDVNAFATGRKTVCFNRGLLQLTDAEIKGVFQSLQPLKRAVVINPYEHGGKFVCSVNFSYELKINPACNGSVVAKDRKPSVKDIF